VVRGADANWIRSIYGIALVPDAILYLRIKSVEELATRVLVSGRGFDYWESGMDLGLGNDYYDSFVAYQKLLLKEFDRMKTEYNFQVIDASRPVKRVATSLRQLVKKVVDLDPLPVAEPAGKEPAKAEVKENAGADSRAAATKTP
jgi:dTMP kinase